MRSAAALLIVLAACSAHPTHKSDASKPDDGDTTKPCCVLTEPPAWQAPTGPRSLGIAADILVDGQKIVIAGYDGLLISEDDGATWHASGDVLRGREGQVLQLGNTILALNEAVGVLEATSDYGETWTQPFPDLGVNSLTGDSGEAWITGASRKDFTAHVLHTTNGLSWNEVPAGAASIVVPVGDFLVSMDFGGGMAISEDGGKDWSPIQGPYSNQFFPILVGWMGSIYQVAAGNDVQNIAASADRGKSWDTYDAGLNVGWRGWFEPSSDGLFLVTALGEILRLRQPGGTWEDVERPKNPGRITVDAVHGGPEGMFVARGGSLYRWNDVTSAFEPHGDRPVRSYVNGMAASGEDVWALVDGREVHHSPDGGVTWSVATPPPAQSLTAVAVWGDVVFVGSLQEGLFRSSDGGKTWDDLSDRIPSYNGTAGLQPRDINDLLVADEGLYVSTGGLEFLGATDGNFQGTSAGVLFSPDGGESFSVFTQGLPKLTGLPEGSREALAALGRMGEAQGVLFVDGQGGVFRSVNHGKNWSGPALVGGDQPFGELRNVVPFGDDILAGFVTDPTHPSGLFVSSDQGKTFAPLDARPPGNTLVASVAATAGGLAALMVTGVATPEPNEGVWESLDQGATWARAGKGSPPRNGLRLLATPKELLVSTVGAGVARLPMGATPTK